MPRLKESDRHVVLTSDESEMSEISTSHGPEACRVAMSVESLAATHSCAFEIAAGRRLLYTCESNRADMAGRTATVMVRVTSVGAGRSETSESDPGLGEALIVTSIVRDPLTRPRVVMKSVFVRRCPAVIVPSANLSMSEVDLLSSICIVSSALYGVSTRLIGSSEFSLRDPSSLGCRKATNSASISQSSSLPISTAMGNRSSR